jgi:hypothetical protein
VKVVCGWEEAVGREGVAIGAAHGDGEKVDRKILLLTAS